MNADFKGTHYGAFTFYKIPAPFIIILSQKNAPFRNILLLRVRYISMSFFNVRSYTRLGKISLASIN